MRSERSSKSAGILAVIVVVYNGWPALRKLIRSLCRQPDTSWRLFLVNNGSAEAGSDWLSDFYEKTTVISSRCNRGFAGGVNDGIRSARAEGYRRYLILNADTELPENCIAEINKAAAEPGQVGALPVLYGRERKGDMVIQCLGVLADFSLGRTMLRENGRMFYPEEAGEGSPVNCFSGAGFVLDDRVIDTVGWLDERYFLYYEEIDYAQRLAAAGIGVRVLPGTYVWHHHDWSTANTTGYCRQYYYQNRNRILFLRKFKRWGGLARVLIQELLSLPYKTIWCLKTSGWRLVLYYYFGVINGLKGERGPSALPFVL